MCFVPQDIPSNGITLPWGQHLTQNEIHPSDFIKCHRLYAGTVILQRWFCLGYFTKNNESSIRKLVNEVIAYCPKIIAWFDSGKVGKHIGTG